MITVDRSVCVIWNRVHYGRATRHHRAQKHDEQLEAGKKAYSVDAAPRWPELKLSM